MARIEGSTAYEALQQRVAEEKLSITWVLGLPRGGTTAVERFVFESLAFDGNVNEPSLCAAPLREEEGMSERAMHENRLAHEEATFGQVLTEVQRLERQAALRVGEGEIQRMGGNTGHGHRQLRIVTKEVSNKVLPWMVSRWCGLAHVVLVVVRNPLLQLESRLKSILDRIGSGALAPWGLQEDFKAADMRIHGKPLVHVDAQCLVSGGTWRDVWSGMCKRRDYSELSDGVVRLSTLHPFCAARENQDAMLAADGHPAPALPLHLNDFATLSFSVAERMFDWRLGWLPLTQQLRALESQCRHGAADADARKAKVPWHLVDFSSFQMDPEGALAPLIDRLACCWKLDSPMSARRTVQERTVPSCSQRLVTPISECSREDCKRECHGNERERMHDDGGNGLKMFVEEDFHLFTVRGEDSVFSSGDWDAWYGKPCFTKVQHAREVEPVNKSPIQPIQLPAFLRGPRLADALLAYQAALAMPQAIDGPPPATRLPYLGVDPLHDLMCDPHRPPDLSSQHLLSTISPARTHHTTPWVGAGLRQRKSVAWTQRAPVVEMEGWGWDGMGGQSSRRVRLALREVWRVGIEIVECVVAGVMLAGCMAMAMVTSVLPRHRGRWSESVGRARGQHGVAGGEMLEPPGSCWVSTAFRVMPKTPTLSVVIPVYNEEACLATCLAALAQHASLPGLEVVIVDGGSADASIALVKRITRTEVFQRIPVKVVTSKGGRGVALERGVAESRACTLLLLHADMVMPSAFDALVVDTLNNCPDVALCTFSFQLNRSQLEQASLPGLWLLERAAALRTRWLGLPFGDQGLAVTRQTLSKAGGVSPMPILEDFELVLRLRSRGIVRCLPQPALSSPRRYHALGVALSSAINLAVLCAFAIGLPPKLLYQAYYALA